MIFKEKKNKKNEKNKHWLLYLLTGVLFFELFKFFHKENNLKDKIYDIEHNFLDFLHKEKKEVVRLENHKENLKKFSYDSYHIFLEYFIPYDGNNHKPKILHPHSLLVIGAAILFLKVALVSYLFLAHPGDGYMSEEIVRQVVAKVNQDRVANNLPELEFNSTLSASAKLKAEDMLLKDYFAHYNPEGKKPWDFIDRNQYEYLYVGENLAINFSSAEAVHLALMNSPSHKKNILSDRYKDIGIAMLSGELDGKQTNVLVEFFASKKETPKTDNDVAQDVVLVKAEEPKVIPKEEILVLSAAQKDLSKVDSLKESKMPSPEIKKNLEENNSEVIEKEIEKQGIVSAAAPKISKEIVSSPAMLMIETNKTPSPNSELEEVTKENIIGFEDKIDKKAILGNGAAKSVNILMLGVLLVVCALLFINIIVRFEVQHKPVIIQTLFLIFFITSLLVVKFHELEGGLTNILIL